MRKMRLSLKGSLGCLSSGPASNFACLVAATLLSFSCAKEPHELIQAPRLRAHSAMEPGSPAPLLLRRVRKAALDPSPESKGSVTSLPVFCLYPADPMASVRRSDDRFALATRSLSPSPSAVSTSLCVSSAKFVVARSQMRLTPSVAVLRKGTVTIMSLAAGPC